MNDRRKDDTSRQVFLTTKDAKDGTKAHEGFR